MGGGEAYKDLLKLPILKVSEPNMKSQIPSSRCCAHNSIYSHSVCPLPPQERLRLYCTQCTGLSHATRCRKFPIQLFPAFFLFLSRKSPNKCLLCYFLFSPTFFKILFFLVYSPFATVQLGVFSYSTVVHPPLS